MNCWLSSFDFGFGFGGGEVAGVDVGLVRKPPPPVEVPLRRSLPLRPALMSVAERVGMSELVRK